MSKNKSNCYLPKDRAGYAPDERDLISEAPNGDITPLPNPATDPIVSNNIVTSEFDYIQSVSEKDKC